MSILPHARMPERGHAPAASVAFVVHDQATSSPTASAEVLRIVDSQTAGDFDPFAELTSGPVIVCVDELAELLAGVEARVVSQRAEWHLDVSDDVLCALAVRSVRRHRWLWHRFVVRIGGARRWFERLVRTPGAVMAYGCPDCGHLDGCGCDCCPYPLPAVTR